MSLVSGAAVAAACGRLGYQVIEADVMPDDLSALENDVDLVFPVLHGRFGEDGELQAILEERGLPFVGSGAAASRHAMDKDATKRTWQQAGLPTAPWATVDSAQSLTMPFTAFEPPVIVKPVADGSSIGIDICETMESLHDAVAQVSQTGDRVLIEKCLVGPEVTVGILGDTPLPIIQIKPAKGFYDYDAKYNREDTAYLFDPEFDGDTYRQVQEIAIQAFRALGCRDYGRVDLIVDEATGPQLLEINTIPGFTPHSLLPKSAAHEGIEFDQLVSRLVLSALDR